MLHEREHPWHLRRPGIKHYQWAKNLADTHELTTAWMSERPTDFQLNSLPSGALSPTEEKNLWMLEFIKTIRSNLDPILDDALPDDCLARLELTVRAIQSFVLRTILTRNSDASPALAKVSNLQGELIASNRWAKLPKESRDDARGILLALDDSPFRYGPRWNDAFMVRRAVADFAEIELRECPHRGLYAEQNTELADELCAQHGHWMNGFIRSLNPDIRAVSRLKSSGSRCLHKWALT